jgi:hypothetical protein
MTSDCNVNTDPLKLVREGSSQAQRLSAELDPGSAPVDQRGVAHGMLFARAYAAFLKYYDAGNSAAGDWTPFFANDVSVRLAGAAVQDVAGYKANLKSWFDFLDERDNAARESDLKDRLGYLFSAPATLAAQLDRLQQGLPAELPLQGALANLIRHQLAPAFRQLMLYYRDGLAPAGPPAGPYHHALPVPFNILGGAWSMQDVEQQGLSSHWIADDVAVDWTAYLTRLADPAIYPPTGIYGNGATLFERINHIATHNLFTSVFDRFLKVYARTVGEAATALEASLTSRDTHEPHYALLLAFLRLFENARTELNTLTGRHLDFYYRDILRLKQKPAQPGRVRLLAELARQAPAHLLGEGTQFRAGKDQLGVEALFAASRDTVLNQAKVAALKTVYRHGDEPVGVAIPSDINRGRLYASPVANSEDGLGAPLTSSDGSWHPFHNKHYADGALASIDMPPAQIGFAIASHYLLMAQGARSISVEFDVGGGFGKSADFTGAVTCLLTTEKGWFETAATKFGASAGQLRLELNLTGADPAITPYVAKVHGGAFATALPLLVVKLQHSDTIEFVYARLQDLVLRGCTLTVAVAGLKTLAVSNDFGPVDTSKPFQPFGASPVKNSALVVGSKEAFQKTLTAAALNVEWLAAPNGYKSTPLVGIDVLSAGQWEPSGNPALALGSTSFPLDAKLDLTVLDRPDLSAPEQYGNTSRHGFVRLKLDRDFGQATYQAELIAYLRKDRGATDPGSPRPPPVMSALSMSYTASQAIGLASADPEAFARRAARFFHVAPFGEAEQHPLLSSALSVTLLPQFDFRSADAGSESGAEFYIGVSALQPPQTLRLLLQVAAGTADPLAKKPVPHVSWSYLRADEWLRFGASQVEDGTAGLLMSGIVSLDLPRDASGANTLLPSGLHWIRLSVAREVDAACRLLLVAAQGLEATFLDRGNDPAFSAQVLAPGTVTRLAEPDAAIKQLTQPFASFGGRGAEAAGDFYTRISERLRHKDRAITLWDAEHLILEAFPAIYRAKCLNHTQYEPGEKGKGVYRELAPGHVTIVTIPSLAFQNQRDPLRPYTSLDVLTQIEQFLRSRYACFVRLHVRNPQFEEVRLAFRLRLRAGYDDTFYVNKLQEEVTRFLSPWAFPGGALPSFGGKIRKSVLIDMVEQLPYVDYVTDFQLFHDVGGVAGTSDNDEVEGSKAVSVLVSAPARKHIVTLIHDAAAGPAGELCPCEAS